MRAPFLLIIIAAVILAGGILYLRGEPTARAVYQPPATAPFVLPEVEPEEVGVCGIFALDNAQSSEEMPTGCPMRDGVLRQVADVPYVRGVAWRQTWACFEPTEGVYDFSGIDYMISLAEEEGKKISLSLAVAFSEEPSYIIEHPGVSTYYDLHMQMTRAVPWDPYLIQRFQAFAQALAEHQAPCSACGGALIPLKNHPVLTNVRLGIPGLGHLRDRPGQRVADIPGYTRQNLLNTVYWDLHAGTDNFPSKQVSIPMWKVQDDTGQFFMQRLGGGARRSGTEAWQDVQAMIIQEFDGDINPKVSFFMENLAAYVDDQGNTVGLPTTEFAAPVYLAQSYSPTEFQALASWLNPSPEHAPKVAGTTPIDGVLYGESTYNTHYFELYSPDVQYPPYQPALQAWYANTCLPQEEYVY